MNPVYLHGLGQTPASWDAVTARLGLGGVCPDLTELCRGRPAAYQSLYEGLSETCSQLGEPVDLCGLSLGGVLALHYAAAHPENVNSLVLIAAQYKMPKGLLRFQNLLFQCLPKALFPKTGFEKKAYIQLCRTMMDLDLRGAMAEITCPVLVVCGERDSANKRASEEMAALLKNARLQILRGAGHEVNTDAPEALAEALRAFYQQIP